MKFLVVTILVLLVVWLLYYLLNKISARYPAPVVEVLAANQPDLPKHKLRQQRHRFIGQVWFLPRCVLCCWV